MADCLKLITRLEKYAIGTMDHIFLDGFFYV